MFFDIYYKTLATLNVKFHKNVPVKTSLHGMPALLYRVPNLRSYSSCVRFLSSQLAAQVQSLA